MLSASWLVSRVRTHRTNDTAYFTAIQNSDCSKYCCFVGKYSSRDGSHSCSVYPAVLLALYLMC